MQTTDQPINYIPCYVLGVIHYQVVKCHFPNIPENKYNTELIIELPTMVIQHLKTTAY
jgi:hypothetical protein